MEAAQTPPMPTPEDAKAIFDRADQAARRAETAAQRLEAAQTAARSETESRFEGMPEELVKQISEATGKAVVDALNSQYELASRPTSPPPESTDAGGTTNAAAGESAADATPPPERRRSIADRVLGIE